MIDELQMSVSVLHKWELHCRNSLYCPLLWSVSSGVPSSPPASGQCWLDLDAGMTLKHDFSHLVMTNIATRWRHWGTKARGGGGVGGRILYFRQLGRGTMLQRYRDSGFYILGRILKLYVKYGQIMISYLGQNFETLCPNIGNHYFIFRAGFWNFVSEYGQSWFHI